MVKRRSVTNKQEFFSSDKDLNSHRPGRPRLAFESSAERTLHQQHLKAERNRRYKAKLQQEKLDGKGQRLQAYKDRRNLQKTRRFGNYALLNAPTAAAMKRLAIGKDHVDKQYAAMQAAHSEWSRLVQREPELSAVCAELPDLLRNSGKTFYVSIHKYSSGSDNPGTAWPTTAGLS